MLRLFPPEEVKKKVSNCLLRSGNHGVGRGSGLSGQETGCSLESAKWSRVVAKLGRRVVALCLASSPSRSFCNCTWGNPFLPALKASRFKSQHHVLSANILVRLAKDFKVCVGEGFSCTSVSGDSSALIWESLLFYVRKCQLSAGAGGGFLPLLPACFILQAWAMEVRSRLGTESRT